MTATAVNGTATAQFTAPPGFVGLPAVACYVTNVNVEPATWLLVSMGNLAVPNCTLTKNGETFTVQISPLVGGFVAFTFAAWVVVF